MSINCGIVGLPNVGKSTLFNCLTESSKAAAENYPFCTIEPNKASVPVYDCDLLKLSKIANSQNIIYAQFEMVDIAGLVKGAHEGEGLGNKFLSHIREVDAIIHVVRCFDDKNISHVVGNIDPVRDIEIIENELLLADLASLERMVDKKYRKINEDLSSLASDLLSHVREGTVISKMKNFDYSKYKLLNLLTIKPILYVCNIDESSIKHGNKFLKNFEEYAVKNNLNYIVVSAAIETEIANMPEEDRKDYLSSVGLESTGLNKVIKKAYSLLNLISYYTVGPKEGRAWTIVNGTLAPQAAGVIHTDFERGFICADVIAYQDFIKHGGEAAARDAGVLRKEGKNYVVQPQDIIHFKFNV